jgi:hypothetical protein
MINVLVMNLPGACLLSMVVPVDQTEDRIDRLNSDSYLAGVGYHKADLESLQQRTHK